MQATYISLLLLAARSAVALVPRSQSCCFQLTASGAQAGPVGQLSDGQNRVHGNLPIGQYCMNGGTITDGHGRGCILTPPTTQFQCDQGAIPQDGFSVSNSGLLQYNSSAQFHVCPTGDNGAYNIYTVPPPGQGGCGLVTLGTGNACFIASSSAPMSIAPARSRMLSATATLSSASQYSAEMPSQPYAVSATTRVVKTVHCPGSSPKPSIFKGTTTHYACAGHATSHGIPASSQGMPMASPPVESITNSYSAPTYGNPTASRSPTTASKLPASACVAALTTGAYQVPHQVPHMIVPVNKNSPSTSYGEQYSPSINQDNSTVFTFDYPTSYAGKTCSLVFLWPRQDQLETSSFTTSGTGDLIFYELHDTANSATNYANAIPANYIGGIKNPTPGNSYIVTTTYCKSGESDSIKVGATGDLSLSYFQDYNPSPIGLYVTSC